VRIAAHDAIIDRYDRVLSELDARIARAKGDRLDVSDYPYRDKDGRPRTIDLAGLRDDLQRQEGMDAGRADRKAARDCRSDAPENAAGMAAALAAAGMSGTIAARATNGIWPGDLFGPHPDQPLAAR
jgi:hypothetical protein